MDELAARLVIDPDFRMGEIDPRLYGSFVEHVGRTVYQSLYEPGHPMADETGFRRDVLEVVRELRIPVFRYPGGCFVSAYNWEDGIGPREGRPRRLEPIWRTIETNAVGLNEFVGWSRRAGGDTMYVVNLGTRGIDAARDVVEYCNHPGGTYWSDLRRAHGYAAPHRIALWGLDNEQDGPWEVGHRPAEQYGWLAHEAAKLMKWVDPSIEIAVNGSSGRHMPTFPDWDLTVLEMAYDYVDYLSIHTYLGNQEGLDTASFLACPLEMDDFIEKAAAACDVARAKLRRSRRIHLSLDEWNVWYHTQERDRRRHPRYLFEERRRSGRPPLGVGDLDPWAEVVPWSEDIYTMEDALVLGGMLLALIRHADRVKIACFTSIVNNVAPIMTVPGGPVWRQTTFYPFLHASLYGRGAALDVRVRSPLHETARYGPVPVLDAAATIDDARGELTIFAVNRAPGPLILDGDVRAPDGYTVREHLVLAHDDLTATNTAENPGTVVPYVSPRAGVEARRLRARLPGHSWNILRLAREAAA